MVIGIGSDHAGYALKNEILLHLESSGYEVHDFGAYNTKSVDYPDYGVAVAEAVMKGECEKGIIICGTGIGISIAANKIPGIRAALCTDEYMAKMSVEHNNANILALGARVVGEGLALDIVDTWLNCRFSGGKHEKRVDKLNNILKTEDGMENVFVFDHPLIQHKVSLLRDKNTTVKEFRELVSEISMLMGYEVTRNMPLKEVEIETPVGIARTNVISGKKLGIVPILRAGLGMVDGMLSLLPMAKVGHIGLYRDPETLRPVEYYCKLPIDAVERDIVILDPMLATGGSASAAIRFIKDKGVTNVSLMCIIAAPEGIKKINEDHPDVMVYCASVDEKLNDHGYIVPGLGDAGDRLFGTK